MCINVYKCEQNNHEEWLHCKEEQQYLEGARWPSGPGAYHIGSDVWTAGTLESRSRRPLLHVTPHLSPPFPVYLLFNKGKKPKKYL